MINENTSNNKLVHAICTQCGGQVEVDSSQEVAICKFCGTTFLVEKAIQNYYVQNAKIEHVESLNINKRGTIESVLSFVERQQDKKQQKIDEEKRRLEEQKRKQEERNKETIDQLFNKKYRKRNLIILGVVFVVFIIFNILGGSNDETETIAKINMPSSSSDFEGENYQDVISDLKNAGFTNIETEIIDDLVFGWLTKDGEVEEISVDGYTIFSTSSSYPENVPIVVTYHTFPDKELEETVEEDVKTEETKTAVETRAEPEKEVTEETRAEPEKETTEELVEEDYSDINQLIFEDLVMAQGWAIGALDRDGNPTENGTPSPAFTYSLYIENITYLGDKIRISVFSEFAQLPDEEKTYIANIVQSMVKVHTNKIPYTTVRLNGNVIGTSKITNSQAFNWD